MAFLELLEQLPAVVKDVVLTLVKVNQNSEVVCWTANQ